MDMFWSGKEGQPPLPDFGCLLHLQKSVSEMESILYSASQQIGQILHLWMTIGVGMSVDSYRKSSSTIPDFPELFQIFQISQCQGQSDPHSDLLDTCPSRPSKPGTGAVAA